jgi:hypothetical protein
MRITLPTLIVVSLLLVPAASRAQPADPSGHWEGTITIPGGGISFQIDLAKNAQGTWVATYSRPEEHLNGLPMTNVTLDGRAIAFELPVDGVVKFQGLYDADSTTISGDVTAAIGSAPFNLTRTGDARLTATPRNGPIDKTLEGLWHATLALPGRHLRLVLRLSNEPDGTSSGTITSVDQGGIELPLGLMQNATSLTLNAPAIGGDFYAGALNAAGELAGTFTQGQVTAPLTFVRAK